MPDDLITIIMPNYNSMPFLSDAVQTVIDQRYQEWELLVIDDQSGDDSVSVVESLADRDERVRLIKLEHHAGPAVARNRGIREARGRYIAFLDSDDLFHPDKLLLQVGFMRKNGLALSHTYYEVISGVGDLSGALVSAPFELSYHDLLKSNQIGCSTVMYDTRYLGKVYMPEIKKRQDYGLWLRILRKGVAAYCLPISLSYYRVREGSVSGRKINLIHYNWRLLREFEGLGRVASAYYLSWQMGRAMRKHVGRRYSDKRLWNFKRGQ